MKRLLFPLLLVSLGGCIFVDDHDHVHGEPPLLVYDPCNFTSECELLADRCFDITIDYGTRRVSDAMCSLFCVDDFDCPEDGACLSIDGEEPICYARCFDDFDCPIGFGCLDAIGPRTIDAVCLPE